MTRSFHDTRWTLISRSNQNDAESKTALSELCETYYAPVVTFLMREGRKEDTARELAHDFFARLLVGNAIQGADPARGRFRNFLLGSLKHFAADQRDRLLAAKRGGGQAHERIPGPGGETGAGIELADHQTTGPDAAFDREWALILLGRALARLEQQMKVSGKETQFATLKPWLTGEAQPVSMAEAGAALDMNEDAVKMAVHRLRKRFRDAVKEEIAQTVNDPGQVKEELEALMTALRRASA